ncbi:hypothetical protein SMICM304S_01920 [Streptomyces microflavus]
MVSIAFAVGVFPISGGSDGFGSQPMALVTALAVHAGWLYGGTLIAGLIASVRKVRHMQPAGGILLARGVRERRRGGPLAGHPRRPPGRAHRPDVPSAPAPAGDSGLPLPLPPRQQVTHHPAR